MKMKLLLILLLLIVIIPRAHSAELVKIGLLDDVSELVIGANSGIKVVSTGLELKFNEKTYRVKKEDEFIVINNRRLKLDRIQIYSLEEQSLLTVNGRSYRGNLELLNRAQGLTVINEINFNYYLASVVGSEINATWPMEALKAQAIVARTYALRNLNSHLDRGYNLSATVRSQAYKGFFFEHPRTIQAVWETENEVAKYQGNLISAVYHSTAGGKTAKGSTIWASNTPYLQSVTSPDQVSPHYMWQKEYSKRDIERILIKEGIGLFSLKDITLSEIGPSGRPKSLLIHDLNGKVYEVDSSKFRFWLGLKSTRFIINKNKFLRLIRPVSQFSFDLTTLGLNSTFFLDDNSSYSFSGYGWGHGVGMSQWGAYQLAKDGYSYQEILTHYYQGVEIIKERLEE